jgi:hypothetical protein
VLLLFVCGSDGGRGGRERRARSASGGTRAPPSLAAQATTGAGAIIDAQARASKTPKRKSRVERKAEAKNEKRRKKKARGRYF